MGDPFEMSDSSDFAPLTSCDRKLKLKRQIKKIAASSRTANTSSSAVITNLDFLNLSGSSRFWIAQARLTPASIKAHQLFINDDDDFIPSISQKVSKGQPRACPPSPSSDSSGFVKKRRDSLRQVSNREYINYPRKKRNRDQMVENQIDPQQIMSARKESPQTQRKRVRACAISRSQSPIEFDKAIFEFEKGNALQKHQPFTMVKVIIVRAQHPKIICPKWIAIFLNVSRSRQKEIIRQQTSNLLILIYKVNVLLKMNEFWELPR